MSRSGTIRWGILGAGYIAGEFVKDFAYLQRAELVAVAASEKSRAENFATQHGIPHAFLYEELYTSPLVDAVYIATTHNFHFEQVMACLNHGKAVLCEKPITVNPEQFQQLCDKAREKNLFLMEAVWTWFLPAVQQVKSWITDGRIGKLKMIQADFAFAAPYKPEGRLYNPHLAGGSLLDIGIYPIAMASFLMDGLPSAIHATGNFTDTGVDESIAMLLDYGHCKAMLASSIASTMGNEWRIYGDAGSIVVPEFWKAKQATLFNNDKQQIDQFVDGRLSRGFIYEMQDATDAILEGRTQSETVPWERSAWLQQIMMEVRKQIGLIYPFE